MTAAARCRARIRLPVVAVRRRRRLHVAGFAERDRLRIGDFAGVESRAIEAIHDVRRAAVLAAMDRMRHVGEVDRLARVRVDRGRVVADRAVFGTAARPAVLAEAHVAGGAVGGCGNVLARSQGPTIRHEILERIVRRQRAGATRHVDRNADSVGQGRIVADRDRCRDRAQVDRRSVTILARSQLLPTGGHAAFGVGLHGAGQDRGRNAGRTTAIDVALPARWPPVGGRHQLRDTEAQSGCSQAQHGAALVRLDGDLDDGLIAGNSRAVDGRDQRPDVGDLLRSQGRPGTHVADVASLRNGDICRSGGAGRARLAGVAAIRPCRTGATVVLATRNADRGRECQQCDQGQTRPRRGTSAGEFHHWHLTVLENCVTPSIAIPPWRAESRVAPIVCSCDLDSYSYISV